MSETFQFLVFATRKLNTFLEELFNKILGAYVKTKKQRNGFIVSFHNNASSNGDILIGSFDQRT